MVINNLKNIVAQNEASTKVHKNAQIIIFYHKFIGLALKLMTKQKTIDTLHNTP